jgi:tungstate transport system ATP-binding protein
MSLIELREISKSYGNFRLQNISLKVGEREIVSIIGNSGSGKTTLLRILALLEKPDSGEYYFKGRPAGDELKGRITFVPQNPVMFRGSVFSNVAYGLKIRRKGRETIRKKVEEVLDTVGLSGYEKRNARSLSSGEQQRVAIARAIAIEPDVLLLDEPTSNLDPANVLLIEKVIKSLTENGITILLATHNLFQAKRLSDKVVHIHEGKILSAGSVDDVFENPKNEVTRKFVSGELYF